MARRDWLLLNLPRLAAAASAVFLASLFILAPLYAAYSLLHPGGCGACSPAAGVEYENFTLSVGGVSIHGFVLNPGAGDGPVYVVMHPYGGCGAAPPVANVSLALAGMGYTVVVFDFRGHGCSGGYTTLGVEELRDAQAVVDYAASRYPGRPIRLVGFGMGAAVAILEANSDPRVEAVAADAPYCRLASLLDALVRGRLHLPLAPFVAYYADRLLGAPLNPMYGPCLLPEIYKPLLVVHESGDSVLTEWALGQIVARASCSRVVEVEAPRLGAVEAMGVANYTETIVKGLDMLVEKCSG